MAANETILNVDAVACDLDLLSMLPTFSGSQRVTPDLYPISETPIVSSGKKSDNSGDSAKIGSTAPRWAAIWTTAVGQAGRIPRRAARGWRSH